MTNDNTGVPLTRRRAITLAGTTALTAGLAGCTGGDGGSDGSGDGDGSPTGDEGTDDGSSSGNGSDSSSGEDVSAWAFAIHFNILDNLAESYDGQHNVTAVEQPPGKIAQKLVTSMQSQSNLPTISLTREGQIRPFSLNGGIVNVDDIVREHEDKLFDVAKSRFLVEPDAMQKTGEGSYYGFPNDLGPMAVLYNTNIFEKAGLPTDPDEVEDEITTWDEYIEAGKTIESETGASMLSFDYKGRQSGVVHSLMHQAGGLYYNEDGKFAFDQEANVRAMETAQKLTEVNRRESWFSEKYIGGLKNGEIATIPAPGWFKFVMRGSRSTRGSLGDMSGVWRAFRLPKLGDSPRAANFGGVPATIPVALSEAQKAAGRDFGAYWHLSEDSFNEKLRMGAFPAIKVEGAEELVNGGEEYYGGQNVNKVFVDSAENCLEQYLPPNQTVRTLHFEGPRQILEDGKPIQETLTKINNQMVSSFS